MPPARGGSAAMQRIKASWTSAKVGMGERRVRGG
jgi:hypothetical protein